MTTGDALDRSRGSFGRHAWADAFSGLSAADHEAPLSPEDLERLALAAYLAGRDDDSAGIWARAYHERLHLADAPRSARCAFWPDSHFCTGASSPAAAAGSPGPGGCLTTTIWTASSRGTCFCRPHCRAWQAA